MWQKKEREKDTQVDLEENLRVSDHIISEASRLPIGVVVVPYLLTHLLTSVTCCGFWSHQSSTSVSVSAGFRVVEKGGVTFSSCTGG